MSVEFQSVLITGTTSGLGRAFMEYYHQHGVKVIAVNRRVCPKLYGEFPGIRQEVLDIADKPAVQAFLGALVKDERVPDLFILNAGINRPDNVSGLEYEVFYEVMRTNLFGVLSFVGAIHELGIAGKTIAAISSTSNIVPNPGHVAYHVSKLALHKSFKLLARKDPANRYRTIVLGPVRTNIMAGYSGPQGIQGKILEELAIAPGRAASHCAGVFEGSRWLTYYPFTAWVFYETVRWLVSLFPGMYQGTVRET